MSFQSRARGFQRIVLEKFQRATVVTVVVVVVLVIVLSNLGTIVVLCNCAHVESRCDNGGKQVGL